MSQSQNSGSAFAVPDRIAALGPDVVAAVESLVRRAERAQGQELLDAADRTLKIVPWPLRGVVKKIIGV